MQLHTKILLGMFLGAFVGLFLGPKSSFLPKKRLVVKNAEQAFITKERAGVRIDMPKNNTIALDSDVEILPDAEFVQGSFVYDKKFALADTDGRLKKALGVERVGDEAAVWLKRSKRELPTGEVFFLPEPISAAGDEIVGWVAPFGRLFMRLIKMVIVPLVFASLLVGVAGLGDIRKLGRIGARTLVLYLGTTAVAVTIGLLLASAIKPGTYIAEKDQLALQAQFDNVAVSKVESAQEAPSFIDNIINIVPDNPVESMVSGNMLQVIFFTLIFGIALTLCKQSQREVVTTFLDAVQDAMIKIIHMVMVVAPIGVFALIADVIGGSGFSVLASLLAYSLVVVVGLLLQMFLVYGALVRFGTPLPFVEFLKATRPAQLLGFSTSSSGATLPVTLECAEQNMGMSQGVASFVLPLGATMNMDGTALLQGAAAVFIAQVFGMDLSIGAQLGIVFTATAASIGTAAVPGAGMIMMAMVLTTAGIPTEGVALILGVDRILDMCRTVTNVTGDLAVASVVASREGEKLRILTQEEDENLSDRGFEGRLEKDK